MDHQLYIYRYVFNIYNILRVQVLIFLQFFRRGDLQQNLSRCLNVAETLN